MAIVGISALRPDLVVLDEFQRFKDLLNPDPTNFAAELAHRLFDYVDPDTGRPTRTLLLSATPYRMYTTADEPTATTTPTSSPPARSCSETRPGSSACRIASATSVARSPRPSRSRGARTICADIAIRPAGGDGEDRTPRRHARP